MNSMGRRIFLRGLGLGTAAALASTVARPAAKRPNILYIMSDDHAAHALSCYGSKINKTPNLDRIANEGIRFENSFCTNSICAPCRAVVLTGKYSHLNGQLGNRDTFDGGQQTFPKLLRQAGYETAIVGKWHLKSAPTGFDYWNVLPGQGAYHNPAMIEMGENKKHEGYTTDLIADFSLEWLKNRNPDKPFMLMCHHKAPHRNWKPDEKHRKIWENVTVPLPETFDDDYATRSAAARDQAMTIERHMTRYDVKFDPPAGLEGHGLKVWKYQRYMQDYLACVESVDDNVGRLLDYLEETGLAENTLVIYTSDQGFYLGDHGWFDKRFMYEESLRMPLIVKLPGAIKAGTVTGAMALNLDFAETFLDYAGVPIPEDMQGASLRPILEGKKPADWRDAMYYHYYDYPSGHSVKRHYGVRTQRYKLIHFYHDIDAWELYDLETDPNELKNLYGNPEYGQITARLKQRLAELQEQYGDSHEAAMELVARTKKKQ